MSKHVMAMTYAPKIPHVRSGECKQTIRTGDKVSSGDQIFFHGWSGKPYRSKWDWRMRVMVTEVIQIIVDPYAGIGVDDHITQEFIWYNWDSQFANKLAEDDFIDPPTGPALREVLSELNGKMSFTAYQIIRWVVGPEA